MSNKPRSKIYEDVVNLLKKSSYTILQIAEHTKINWETAKNAVETLSKINLITPTEKNGKTYYQVNEANFLQLRKDTLLGLPLTEEQEKTTKALFTRIRQRWQEITGRSINKTFQQKILVRLVEENNIQNVPYGWYLFGECAVLFNSEDNDIKPIIKYDTQIEKIIADFSHLTIKELLERHYLNNELYKTKLKIADLLLATFTDESLQQLKRLVRQLVFSINSDKEVLEYINAFHSATVRLVNGYNAKEMEDLRPMINEVFTCLWELIGLFNLKQSITAWYDSATIKRHYQLRKDSLIPELEVQLIALIDHCPPLNIPKDSSILKFKGILAVKPQ
ncbi:hypothetical protein HYU21_03690 [Candidatus Woesearchaeota archaeon]|nr:hypothetical protein [Candidatus Woesearchaeota archaeon]